MEDSKEGKCFIFWLLTKRLLRAESLLLSFDWLRGRKPQSSISLFSMFVKSSTNILVF